MMTERILFDKWFAKRFYKKAYYKEKIFHKWLDYREKYKTDFDLFYDEQGKEFYERMVFSRKRK